MTVLIVQHLRLLSIKETSMVVQTASSQIITYTQH